MSLFRENSGTEIESYKKEKNCDFRCELVEISVVVCLTSVWLLRKLSGEERN